MYGIGDLIVYNEDGVCRVEAIGPLKLSGGSNDRQYYTLCPLFGDGRTFVPVDTALPMRPVATRAEAMDVIRSMPGIEAEVCRLSSRRILEDHYRTMMKPHTLPALVRTLKSVYAKQHDGAKLRTLSGIDEYYRKRAEMLLQQELSVALEIPQEEVEAFIADLLGTGE